MKPLVLFVPVAALLVASLGACELEGDAPLAEEFSQPIVGGQATSVAPATGALVRFGAPHCTATLIETRKLVTAAHCLVGVNPSSLSFVLGTSTLQPTDVLAVASVHPHPSFNFTSLQNDIGYVVLAEDAPVAPVPMEAIDSSWVGRELIFIGYGVASGISQTGAGLKRGVRMKIGQVGASQFAYSDPLKNTCSGDSGGPAYSVDASGVLRLVGVTSYGDATCQQFGVDTRVDVFGAFLGGSGGGSGDSCGGETYEGRCDGDAVIFCEAGAPRAIDCSGSCGYDQQKGFYNCL